MRALSLPSASQARCPEAVLVVGKCGHENYYLCICTRAAQHDGEHGANDILSRPFTWSNR